MEQAVIRARDILKTSDILFCSPEDTLKSALSKLTRSHDAVFVFDQKKKFLGCISPYYSIFKTKYPPDTKVVNCLYRPPQLTSDTYIWDIAKLMLESKIYYLPVFDRSTFLGIVSVNRVLRSILDNPVYTSRMRLDTTMRPLTIPRSATVGQAYAMMRDKHVSRLPVVDDYDKLVGITTRFDIQFAFSEKKQRIRWLSRVGNKDSFLDMPLAGYVKKVVVTLEPEASSKEIISMMVSKNVGSVVIVNKQRKPVGLVSVHDILKGTSTLKPTNGPELTVHASDDFIHTAQLESIVEGYHKKFAKHYSIRSMRVEVATKKNPSGKVSHYTANIHTNQRNKQASAEVTDHDWKRAVRKAFEKVKQQLAHA